MTEREDQGEDDTARGESPDRHEAQARNPSGSEQAATEDHESHVRTDQEAVGAIPADSPPVDVPDEPEPFSGQPPEESISQSWSETLSLKGTRRAELREAYGYVRAAIKARPNRFRTRRRQLRQARIRSRYDIYLARSIRLAAGAVVAGALAGVLVTLTILASAHSFAPLRPLFAFPGISSGIFTTYPALATGLVLASVGGIGAGLATLLGRSYYPRYLIRRRRLSINQNLPYAIMFMYGLSRGGMNFLEVCRRVADAEGMYGEVANEFDVVVREIDLFGNDLLQGLSNVQTLTPSDELHRFIDDLLSVLESGGDLETFLHQETEKYLDTASKDQETFIETVGTLSELFVVAFVAAPLLLIVVLTVVSFIGADTVWIIEVLVYLVFPLGMLGFLFTVDHLSGPDTEPPTMHGPDSDRTMAAEDSKDDPRFRAYRRAGGGAGLGGFLRAQVRGVRHSPSRSLWLTIPAGILAAALVIATGVAEPTVAAFVASPTWTTGWIVVVPLLTTVTPLMVLHERERRRRRMIAQRLPDVLNILSNANEMGVDLVDGCELVSRWSSGVLGTEFQKVRNDLAWNHDLRRALLSFADRMAVPQLSRSMTLIAEGSRASGDLHSLLDIAATDTRARATLERARRRSVNSYVAIVIIGFLVYLLVILMVSKSYLGPIAELSGASQAPDRPAALAGLGAAPVDTYRMLFLHSALIQGFGSGLIAGKLADDDFKSGLRYGIAMVVTTMAAFVIFV